nr:Chain H, ASP-GLY-ALA-ASN-SER-ASP [Vibrio harveyi]
DGANSD